MGPRLVGRGLPDGPRLEPPIPNWTSASDHWQALRRRWEYSHAASAVLNLVAFAAAILAGLWA
jgi:hypothetical protein